MRALVIGGGIFGATTALELRLRGLAVTLVDPGPLPHPLAESTDISKVVRIDYGADTDYTELGEHALAQWRTWPEFHATGVAFLTRAPMQPGGFEHASYTLLTTRGHRLQRLDAAAIARRFPAYRPGAFVDGYTHGEGGWVEAAAVVARFVADARAAGVVVRERCTVDRIVDDGALAGPEHLPADHVVVATGAWAPRLAPALAGALRAVGQPVFHLAPADPALFEAAQFPVFGADISVTGYYGFPVHRGVVKIANHGTGIAMSPDDPRDPTAAQEHALRAMLRDTFPALADAPIVHRQLCVYGDTRDEHFWIARDPDRPHVTVATGGSGHAFKFAPVLGALIADAALGIAHPLAAKFRWRPELAAGHGDAARSR
jgi:glycine/D-amino acid oxidase-like deaminating enzyme